MKVLAVLVVLVVAALAKEHCYGDCQQMDIDAKMNKMMKIKAKDFERYAEEGLAPLRVPAASNQPCVNGMAGDYPCKGVDLLAFVPLAELGSNGNGNDIWGWVDPETNREYAIFCAVDGTSFIDVTVPTAPVVLGYLPTHTTATSWRDVKVYKDHAFIIAESPNHGMQIYDLTELRALSKRAGNYTAGQSVPQLTETAWYNEVTSVHNIAINEESGFAYLVGSRTCRGGLHMVDISSPLEPEFVGCFSDDGYTHDSECITYKADDPDGARYGGREICFNYNEDTLTIVDVTDKSAPEMLSRVPYSRSQYTHQGWLTEDRKYMLMNDELDELYNTNPVNRHTRTLIWDVQKLDAPFYHGDFFSSEQAIDHNLYILGNTGYLSNYCAGLRVMDTSNIASGSITERAFFDVAPNCDSTEFLGTWSNYPYFPSGNVVVSSIDRGLFILDVEAET